MSKPEVLQQSDSSEPETPAKRILIAEDSPVQAVVLRRALEKNGYKVTWAKSGPEGLEKAREIKPDLIISDVEMPEMDGFEMCGLIKHDLELNRTPVIIVTSLSEPEDIVRGMESGADGYVTKPYDEKYLMVRVRTLLATPIMPILESGEEPIEIEYAGRKRVIVADRLRILNLLFSTYENSVKQNRELVNTQMELKKYMQKLDLSYQESENLLEKILPRSVARELKKTGHAEPEYFESATVLFTDFKGFTEIAEGLSPRELVEHLDECFTYFDSVMERFHLEKLKTIGDSYMCAGGVPVKNNTHPVDTVLAALEIQDFMIQIRELKEIDQADYWELRLGVNTGPLVAGVIGERKFAYDVWGDSVNTASRMESSGSPGMVNISDNTYALVKDFFECEYRGKVQAKSKGEVDMYFVHRIKAELSSDDVGRIPNDVFEAMYERLKDGEPQ